MPRPPALAAFAAAFAERLAALIGPRFMAAFLDQEFPKGEARLAAGKILLAPADDRMARRVVHAVRGQIEAAFGTDYVREMAAEAFAEATADMGDAGRARLRRDLPAGLLAPEAPAPALGGEALLAINAQLLQQTQDLEETLEQTRLLTAVVEHAGEAVIVVEGKDPYLMGYANPQWERLTGRKRQDYVNKREPPVMHVLRTHPELWERFQKARAADVEMRFEVDLPRIDNTTVPIEAVISAVRDPMGAVTHFAILMRDLTERRRAGQLIAKHETRFRMLLEQSFDLIMLLDATGTVLYCTPSVTRILGYAPDEFMGRSAFSLAYEEDVAENRKRLAAMIKKGHGSRIHGVAVRMRHKDGHLVTMRGNAVNLLGEPDIQGIVVNASDVSDQVRAEAAMRQMDKLRDQLSGLASGSLLTTLDVVRWNIERLLADEEGRLAQTHADLLRVTQQAATDAGRQLEHLAAAMAIERGDVRYRIRPVTLEQVWRAGPVLIQKRCLVKGVACALRTPRTPLPKIAADPDKLVTALDILFDNAVSYTPRGGKVTMRAAVRNGLVRIEVADTGIGIPEDEQARVFELFMRGSNTGETEGAGIGLYLVKRYAEGMGGRIGFRSAVGVGTTFWIELPAA